MIRFFRLSLFVIVIIFFCTVSFLLQYDTHINTHFQSASNTQLKREMTLEELHVKIWNEIEFLQENGKCEEKKILHCENGDQLAGLGSMSMRWGACMQAAYALGRMFFIHDPRYAHFGGLFRYLKNESSRCGYMKNNYTGMSKCDLHDLNCYLENGYDVNNTHKVVIYRTLSLSPAPRVVPGTLPIEIETILKKNNIKNPYLWFTSQFLGYLHLRLQPATEKLIKTFKTSMHFSYPYTALHCRHGKDKLTESPDVANEKYVDWIDKYVDKFLPNETLKRLFAASDDKDIVENLIKIRPGYTYMHLPKSYTDPILPVHTGPSHMIYTSNKFPKEVLESMIIELKFLTYANYTVCYHTSNICRLIWSLKLSTPPYRHERRIDSVDGYTLQYYFWYGFIAPFDDFWVSTKDFSRELTFPDGRKMMKYRRGDIIKLQGGAKIMKVDNVTYKVRIKERSSEYVLTSDLVQWPGRPSYHFYP